VKTGVDLSSATLFSALLCRDLAHVVETPTFLSNRTIAN
jgi:hypothetical protein